jgi:hypothetical protein
LPQGNETGKNLPLSSFLSVVISEALEKSGFFRPARRILLQLADSANFFWKRLSWCLCQLFDALWSQTRDKERDRK